MEIILKYFSTSNYQRGRQEKQVCGSEGEIAGMGWNTLVFVRLDFLHIFLSIAANFHCW
jgi:hypothetical protein